MAIATALDHHPELLLVLRGIDVANRELSIPSFCLVPLFDRVRAASRRAAARLAVARPRWEVPAMRATCHAGEDFRGLLHGIRRVHELLEFEGVRIVYYFYNENMPVYILAGFAKNEKANLSAAECAALRKLVERILEARGMKS